MHKFISVIFISLCLLFTALAPAYVKADADYSTGLTRWRSADNGFAAWSLDGVVLGSDGSLRLSPSSARADGDPYAGGAYYGHSFYNGGSFLVGEAISPMTPTPFAFTQAIASWNADTPTGAWIESQIRSQTDSHWTKWYNLGVWAADSSTIERHSVRQQDDADGSVAVDTLMLADSAAANAFQLKLRLFITDPGMVPSVRSASVAVSTTPVKPTTLAAGSPDLWNRTLSVPACSQMVYQGGNEWCSPTSTSMIVGYWAGDSIRATPYNSCALRVRAAVEGVYDWLDDGYGNWPFNTAYAATQGLDAYVTRFTHLSQLEPWIASGVPVAVSLAWGPGELTGAPISSTTGHLMVLIGFDAAGNPIVNDPAAATDGEVQRTYRRDQFESLWLGNMGGTAYLIYPSSWPVPRSYAKGWNLVAGPDGTSFNQAGPILYTFQSGGSYTGILKTQGITAGWGYWAYFADEATVLMNGSGGNSYSTSVGPGQFKMVGNPSGVKSATVTADVIYTYDPTAGYTRYQGSAPLEVGQGAWVYSPSGGQVTVTVRQSQTY